MMRMFSNRIISKLLRSQSFRSLTNTTENDIRYPKRIFSGIQPTGAIHLGNYLGAIAQWVELQNQNEDIILSVVDLHSMTLPHNPKVLRDNILGITATLLGCGIDPEKAILFQQSLVPEHTQLAWCLGCICTMPRLSHLPQYKEKSKDLKDIPLGLFIYPVLQAADILAYKATQVPVGEDQIQQIQLTQELARMFNKKFGQTFPIPKTILTGSQYARLRSLREPIKKMSKSDPDPKSRICLTDAPEEILNKIKRAVTDCTSEVSYDLEARPGVSNLINIHSFATNKSIEDICKEAQGLDTGKYKLVVAEEVIAYLKPVQERIFQFSKDPSYLVEVLKKGSEKARTISSENWTEVQNKLGIQANIIQKEKMQFKA